MIYILIIVFLFLPLNSYSNDIMMMNVSRSLSYSNDISINKIDRSLGNRNNFPTNEFCNYTLVQNNTCTYNGKTRYQTYEPNENDNNCTICLHLGCKWCNRMNNLPGYCYNGDTDYCDGENDATIDNNDTCNDDVAIIVIFLTVFLGIILPLCLICGFCTCILYFAHRFWKRRQRETRIIPVECEISTIELQPPYQQYTYVNTIVIDNTNVYSINEQEEKTDDNNNHKVVHAIPII